MPSLGTPAQAPLRGALGPVLSGGALSRAAADGPAAGWPSREPLVAAVPGAEGPRAQGLATPGLAPLSGSARRHRHHADRRARGRARHGEPFVRQPSRDARPERRIQARAWRTTHSVQSIRRRPDTARVPHADDVPAARRTGPGVDDVPRGLRQRRHGRLRPWLGRSGDGLLDPGRPSVHLQPGVVVPHRRPLVLLGSRADGPQPPVPDRRHLGWDDRRRRHSVTERPPVAAGERDDLPETHDVRHRLGQLRDLLPDRCDTELYPVNDTPLESGSNLRPFDQFFTDAAAGTLPSFSFLDEDYDTQSQENPQNIVVGEAMLAQVVQALGNGRVGRARCSSSPTTSTAVTTTTWRRRLPYAPDSPPPSCQPGESTYDGFERYGFRVPGLVVSPYSRRNTSATRCSTTPRSSRWWSGSGTCRR